MIKSICGTIRPNRLGAAKVMFLARLKEADKNREPVHRLTLSDPLGEEGLPAHMRGKASHFATRDYEITLEEQPRPNKTALDFTITLQEPESAPVCLMGILPTLKELGVTNVTIWTFDPNLSDALKHTSYGSAQHMPIDKLEQLVQLLTSACPQQYDNLVNAIRDFMDALETQYQCRACDDDILGMFFGYRMIAATKAAITLRE